MRIFWKTQKKSPFSKISEIVWTWPEIPPTVRKHTTTNFYFSFYTKLGFGPQEFQSQGKLRWNNCEKRSWQNAKTLATLTFSLSSPSSLLKLPNHFFAKCQNCTAAICWGERRQAIKYSITTTLTTLRFFTRRSIKTAVRHHYYM